MFVRITGVSYIYFWTPPTQPEILSLLLLAMSGKSLKAPKRTKSRTLKGMSVERYKKALVLQQKEDLLKRKVSFRTEGEMTTHIGTLLYQRERARVIINGHVPIWPWVIDITNDTFVEPKVLKRIMKESKADGERNPNYGRFYVCTFIPKVDDAGIQVVNEKGYPEEEMVQFEWFSDTDFVRYGAFGDACSKLHDGNGHTLNKLLLTTWGLGTNALWPTNILSIIDDLATIEEEHQDTDVEIDDDEDA